MRQPRLALADAVSDTVQEVHGDEHTTTSTLHYGGTTMPDLVVGVRYKVIFKDGTATKPRIRKMVGVYLDIIDGELLFSLRPDHGTTRLPGAWVEEVYVTAEESHPPRPIRKAGEHPVWSRP